MMKCCSKCSAIIFQCPCLISLSPTERLPLAGKRRKVNCKCWIPCQCGKQQKGCKCLEPTIINDKLKAGYCPTMMTQGGRGLKRERLSGRLFSTGPMVLGMAV